MASAPSQPPSQTFYEIKLPSKGLGVIATTPIPTGTLILSEAPLFTTADLDGSSADATERSLASIIRSLPKDAQRQFLSLHNAFPGIGHPLSNTIRTNAYPLGPGAEVGGLFPTIARLNHSCRPNAQHVWQASKGEQTVHSVRDIAVGEEICLSYHAGGISAQRKKELKDFFGFDCTCELCSLPPDQQAESDRRLEEAQKLDAAIGDPKRVKLRPEEALKDVKKLLEIYEIEGIRDLRVPRAWYDAFQIVGMHGDAARGSVFAKKSREAREVGEGRGSKEAEEMRRLEEKPEKFESWAAGSKKWRSAAKDVPTGLSEKKFDMWLWRENLV